MKTSMANWPRWTALTFAVVLLSASLGFAQRPLPSTESAPAPVVVLPGGTGAPPAQFLVGGPESVDAKPAPYEIISPSTGVFEANDCPNKWRFRVIPFIWVPGFKGDITVRNVTAPVDASIGKVFEIILNDTNFIAAGQIEASNGRVGFIFNGNYVNVSPSKQIRNLSFNNHLALTLLDFVGTYELQGVTDALKLPCGSKFEILAGVRFLSLSAGVTATGPAGNSATRQGTEDWFDPIVGCRFRVPLMQSLTAQVRGDAGGFDLGEASRFTWNVEASLEYRFGAHCSLMGGYRWLDFNHLSGSGNAGSNLNLLLSGPVLGIAFDF